MRSASRCWWTRCRTASRTAPTRRCRARSMSRRPAPRLRRADRRDARGRAAMGARHRPSSAGGRCPGRSSTSGRTGTTSSTPSRARLRNSTCAAGSPRATTAATRSSRARPVPYPIPYDGPAHMPSATGLQPLAAGPYPSRDRPRRLPTAGDHAPSSTPAASTMPAAARAFAVKPSLLRTSPPPTRPMTRDGPPASPGRGGRCRSPGNDPGPRATLPLL